MILVAGLAEGFFRDQFQKSCEFYDPPPRQSCRVRLVSITCSEISSATTP